MNNIKIKYKSSSNIVCIPEEYKTGRYGDYYEVVITTGLNILSKIVNPYILSGGRFISAKSVLQNEDDLETFNRSHKPLYLSITDLCVIVKGRIRIDATTGVVDRVNSKVSFYTPKGYGTDILVCSMLSSKFEIGTERIPQEQLDLMTNEFYNQIEEKNYIKRIQYIESRVL